MSDALHDRSDKVGMIATLVVHQQFEGREQCTKQTLYMHWKVGSNGGDILFPREVDIGFEQQYNTAPQYVGAGCIFKIIS